MKTYYVYELYNSMGTVEYVGETINPEGRLYQHIKTKPNNGHGKFYGRQDISMNIIAEFIDRKEAQSLEGKLKLEYGLEWTEKTRATNTGKKNVENGRWNIVRALGVEKSQLIIHICPHCNIEMKGTNYFRWHGDNCKQKKEL